MCNYFISVSIIHLKKHTVYVSTNIGMYVPAVLHRAFSVHINLSQPSFRMRRKSFYARLSLPHFSSFSPSALLSSSESIRWPLCLLLFQYLGNHKNPSAMSHFSKANLILSRQPMCRTSGNDGCC